MKHSRKHAALGLAVLVGISGGIAGGMAGACSKKTESTGQESAAKPGLKNARIVYYAMPG